MKISVIIPIYNAQQYIEECIASVEKQTLKDLEILCVDDGSTDESLAVLHRLREADERIQIITQTNQGAGRARNNALRKAEGEFVFFLDADDYLLDCSALEQMYQACIEHNVSVCGAFLNCDRHGTIVPMNLHRKECKDYPNGRKFSYKDYQNDFYYIAYLYDRNMLLKHQIFFPDYRRFQDPPFFVNAMLAAKEFYVIPVEVYCIRAGHQNYVFSHRKVNDIVKGITDILEVSVRNNFKELHLLEVSRLNEGYFGNIIQHLTEDNYELLQLLWKANDIINWKWIEEQSGEKTELLKALRFLLNAGTEKCNKYREELERRGYINIQFGSVFPFHKVLPNSKVVLYAAGNMGWAYYEQIKNHEDYKLVGWVDQQYEKFMGKQPKISPVESIGQMSFDYIVIAIENRKTAMEIMNSLKKMEIPDEKIVWSLSI